MIVIIDNNVVIQLVGDSKWLWISLATMYENVCDNCVGGIELTFVWHFISVHLIFFISLHIDLTMFKIARLWSVKEMSALSYPHSCHIIFCTLLPYLFTIILNHSILWKLSLSIFQSVKLSKARRGQCLDGWPPRNCVLRSFITWFQYCLYFVMSH
jgi:hypothetical protein